MLDNVFVQIDDFDKARKFADDINVKRIHRQLDKIVRQGDLSFIISLSGCGYHCFYGKIDSCTQRIEWYLQSSGLIK